MGGSLITASYSSCPWTRLAYLLVEKTGVRFVCDILVVSSSLIVLVREASTWSWNRLPSPLSGNLIPSLWQPSQPSSTTPSASTLMAQRSSSMRSTQKSRSSSTFVAAAEVEVDLLTGTWTCLRADVKMDVGQSINPSIDYGQIQGAFVQGMGLFTMEESLWLWNGPN